MTKGGVSHMTKGWVSHVTKGGVGHMNRDEVSHMTKASSGARKMSKSHDQDTGNGIN